MTTMGSMCVGAEINLSMLLAEPLSLTSCSVHRFYGATNFDQDLSTWDTSSVTTMGSMCVGAEMKPIDAISRAFVANFMLGSQVQGDGKV